MFSKFKKTAKSKQLHFKLSFLFLSSLLLSSCYWGLVNTRFNFPSVGDDYAPSDSSLFYVDLDVDAYESNGETIPYYEISTTEKYGDSELRESPSNCEIFHDDSKDRQSTETLICILDVPEFEFKSRDLHMVYNIPEGMCEYIQVSLPWHFNFEIKEGPYVKSCDAPGSGGDGDGAQPEDESKFCKAECGEDNPCSLENPPREGVNKTCPDDLVVNDSRCSENEDDLCGTEKGTDILCCSGGSREDLSLWRPDEACFGGPGTHVVQADFQDYTKYHTFFAPDGGFRQTISLRNLLEVSPNNSNVSHANYLDILDVSPENLENARSRLPKFLEQSPNYRYIPHWFFDFSCLDSAGETIHQILLMIREWNTFEEFEVFYESGGFEEGDPDVTGTEGDDCPYEERWNPYGTLECNDEDDLGDIPSDGYPRLVLEESEEEEGGGDSEE